MNSDESVPENWGLKGCRGLIRDHNGCWIIKGFSRVTTTLVAEYWGLRDDLELELGINKLAAEFDCAVILTTRSLILLITNSL